MSAIANITVKKANGTDDVVYVAKTPSSGDKVPARWRADALGTANAFKPELQMVSENNGPGTARRCTLTFKYPQVYTDSTTTLKSVKNTAPGQLVMTLPVEMPDTDIDEAVSQFFNLINHASIRTAFKEAFAPT
jgi:hypothetical protein